MGGEGVGSLRKGPGQLWSLQGCTWALLRKEEVHLLPLPGSVHLWQPVPVLGQSVEQQLPVQPRV